MRVCASYGSVPDRLADADMHELRLDVFDVLPPDLDRDCIVTLAGKDISAVPAGFEGMVDVGDSDAEIPFRKIRSVHDFEKTPSEEVLRNWDDLKRKEKHQETDTQALESVAKSLPSLIRAEKLQKKAAKVGFDWDNVKDALDKVQEELETKEFRKQVGGGALELVMTGDKQLKSVTLKPEVVDPEDIEMLQDLIISGVNEILKEVDDYGAAEMEKVTGGVSFPGFI